MSLGRLAGCALLVALTVGLAAVSTVEAQPKGPADFVIEKGKDSPGPVTFSHETHKAPKIDKCQACHTKVFKMKKGTSGTLTMAEFKAGKQCGACHDGKTQMGGAAVFGVEDQASCVKCHKK